MPTHSPRVPLPPVRLATAADAPCITELRDSLARWLTATGVQQWQEGEITSERIVGQLGEWYVAELDGDIVASIRLTWKDPDFWGADDAPAGYVHGLAVARNHAGHGWGRELVEWAATRTVEAKLSTLRLDTAAHNARMISYYEALGFRQIRPTPLPAYLGRDMITMLLERSLIDHPPLK